jgi:hypothetical protein
MLIHSYHLGLLPISETSLSPIPINSVKVKQSRYRPRMAQRVPGS